MDQGKLLGKVKKILYLYWTIKTYVLDTELAKHFLPEEILYFNLGAHNIVDDVIHFYLEEKNIVPEKYSSEFTHY